MFGKCNMRQVTLPGLFSEFEKLCFSSKQQLPGHNRACSHQKNNSIVTEHVSVLHHECPRFLLLFWNPDHVCFSTLGHMNLASICLLAFSCTSVELPVITQYVWHTYTHMQTHAHAHARTFLGTRGDKLDTRSSCIQCMLNACHSWTNIATTLLCT